MKSTACWAAPARPEADLYSALVRQRTIKIPIPLACFFIFHCLSGLVKASRSRLACSEAGGVHQHAALTKTAAQRRYRLSDESTSSLVAVAVGRTAVRTHPGNAVARKPPEILIHTRLAHGETALAAGPAEWDHRPAAMTVGQGRATPATTVGRVGR